MDDLSMLRIDTILRFLRRGQFEKDGRPAPHGFFTRENETGLSVTWTEYWPKLPKPERIAKGKAVTQMTPTKGTGFAELVIGKTLDALLAKENPAKVIHTPKPATERHGPNPAHADIEGLPDANEPDRQFKIGAAIALAVENVHRTE